MKILVICQYYYPEPFRINDICEEFVKRGHEVTVVTGEPNYPEGEIYKGYENHQHCDEIINGVTIHRCPIIPRKTGSAYRFLNYFSYPHLAKRYVRNLMASDGKPFDIVFVNQLSPVMMTEPAITYRKKHNVPIVMYCLDLWPVSLVAGGINRGSFIYKIFEKISSREYKSMNRILITSRMFDGYLENKFGIKKGRIKYLPQYAEGIFEKLPFKTPGETINLVLAGNIGAVQNIDVIIEAAKKIKDRSIRFHIIGGGTDLDRLKKLTSGLDSIIFYGRHPLEEMPDYYAKADAMLVTLKADPVLSLTLPGKVQSYMAVGKPIIGAIDGEAACVIEQAKCGFCGKAGDVDQLIDNIYKFINYEDRKSLGENARLFYEQYFERTKFMDTLENELKRSRRK